MFDFGIFAIEEYSPGYTIRVTFVCGCIRMMGKTYWDERGRFMGHAWPGHWGWHLEMPCRWHYGHIDEVR
jgi:hypothetical protein